MSSWQMTHKMIGNKVAKNTQSRISTLLPNPTRYALGGILPTNSILHEGGGLSNLLQYCIGGEKSLGIPNLYYLMNGRPLIFSLVAYFLQQKWHFFFSLFPCCMLLAAKMTFFLFSLPLLHAYCRQKRAMGLFVTIVSNVIATSRHCRCIFILCHSL